MSAPEPNIPTAEPSLPQPRDIALEMETPEQEAELEAASDPLPGEERPPAGD